MKKRLHLLAVSLLVLTIPGSSWGCPPASIHGELAALFDSATIARVSYSIGATRKETTGTWTLEQPRPGGGFTLIQGSVRPGNFHRSSHTLRLHGDGYRLVCRQGPATVAHITGSADVCGQILSVDWGSLECQLTFVRSTRESNSTSEVFLHEDIIRIRHLTF